MPTVNRHDTIVLIVVALHLGTIYAINSGLFTRAAEPVEPIVILTRLIEPLAPQLAPSPLPRTPQPPQPAPPAQQPVKQPIASAQTAAARLPLAINAPVPAPNAPTGNIAPLAESPTFASAVAPGPVAAPPQPSLQLPSSDADYLQNPRPPYPPISRRLNEQGKTTVRVLIGADGQPQRAEISKSSGFTRLDEAAIATAMSWRYVPGKRGGVAETMWFNVPINWLLE